MTCRVMLCHVMEHVLEGFLRFESPAETMIHARLDRWAMRDPRCPARTNEPPIQDRLEEGGCVLE